MKPFIHTLIIIATLTLGSIALADVKTLVITGRVVELAQGYNTMFVQSGKERFEIVFGNDTYAQKPKVGDTVRVHCTRGHSRFDPEYTASKVEVIAAGGTKKNRRPCFR
jgi:hypothetical protein